MNGWCFRAGRAAVLAGLICLASGFAQAQTQSADGGASENAQKIDVDADNFIEGNLYFVLYHEMGHALVSEFNLAVVGREEDAVDGLATSLMTPADKESTPDYLKGAIKGWFLFASYTKLKDISWWDEHGTSNQRAFQIACLLYGNDPENFADIADAINLPEDRRKSCQHDSEMNETGWNALLDEDTYGENEQIPDDAKEPEIIYNPTEKFQDQQDYIKKLGLLEDIAKFMHDTYKFKPGIKLVANECGQVNAFWNREDRTLTLCYELVDAYQGLAKQMQDGSGQ
jgi:hypothetical protein